jgi:hypothetical protein
MTEPKDFLTRWSRRKQGAKIESEKDVQVDAKPQQTDQAGSGSEAKTARLGDTQRDLENSEEVFDLSKLPSLDSIGPATDIRAFLQQGVPEALSRAALRRAWSADPGIRDFIGLAENSWDFTASDGMHGFGELDPADAKRLLAQLFSEPDSRGDKESEIASLDTSPDHAESNAEAQPDNASDPDSSCNADGEALPSATIPAADVDIERADDDAAVASQHAIASVASQQKEAAAIDTTSVAMPRGHGRALPQ